jgi:hypothetical protein
MRTLPVHRQLAGIDRVGDILYVRPLVVDEEAKRRRLRERFVRPFDDTADERWGELVWELEEGLSSCSLGEITYHVSDQ